MPANPEIEKYIYDYARSIGLDPNVALRVARAEALNVFDPTQPDRGGDKGSSFGPFQLHYGGIAEGMSNPGLGDAFTRDTGLDARNPATWPQQIKYALDTAKRDGWRQWMGAKNSGIGRWEGIRQDAAVSQAPPVPGTTITSKPKGVGGAGVLPVGSSEGPGTPTTYQPSTTPLPPEPTAPATAETPPPKNIKEAVQQDLKKEDGALAAIAENMKEQREAEAEAFAQFSQIQPSNLGATSGNPETFAAAQQLMAQLLAKRKSAIPGVSLTGLSGLRGLG